MKLLYLDALNMDRRYCFVNARISVGSKIMLAKPALPKMQRLEEEFLELRMDEDRGGLDLPDYVSNTSNMLPLRRSFAEAIVDGFDVGEHELLPVRLINEKQRIHSDDYVILNPIGRIDCLDTEASQMNGDEDHPAVQIMGRWALRGKDVPPGRDLLRAQGVNKYIFSDRLVDFIQTGGYTNLNFLPVIVS